MRVKGWGEVGAQANERTPHVSEAGFGAGDSDAGILFWGSWWLSDVPRSWRAAESGSLHVFDGSIGNPFLDRLPCGSHTYCPPFHGLGADRLQE